MPYKYPTKKGWEVPKQKYKITNWPEYNKALKGRGDIEVWISDEAIEQWVEKDRVYDGTGAPKQYSDFAITTCHELRKVFRLPLRQSQGFIDSYFRLKGLAICCPDYSCLSKRLSQLNIPCPRYQKKSFPEENVCALAIDSTGLKRFGRDEWHQEKHKISAKGSWRKLHIAVDDEHYFRGCELTDCFVSDDKALEPLVEQIEGSVHHLSGDGAYDKNPVYETLSGRFPEADIVIPPDSDAVSHDKNHAQRNRNILEIKAHGRMYWQKQRQYGRRNLSELAIQRYNRHSAVKFIIKSIDTNKKI